MKPTCLALAALTLVLLTRDLPAYTDLLINRGAGLARVASIVLHQSLSLMTQMLPFSVLVGGLVGLGRLVADREVMVLSALGFDPRQLIAPVALFGGSMACLALLMSLVISPLAQRELNRAVREMATLNPIAAIEPSVVHRVGEWKLEAREVSRRNQVLRRVLLWMPSIGETIFSETARVSASEDGKPELVLQNGVLLTNTRGEPRAMRFDEMRTRIPQPQGSASAPFEDRLRSLSFADLSRLARDPGSGEQGWEAESELHRRFALPAATVLLGILALPLALSRRRTSRSSGTLIGLAVTVGYYGLVQVAEGIAQGRPSLSGPATWLPNGVLFGLTAFLCLRLVRPWPAGERSARPERRRPSDPGSPARPVGLVRVRRWALSRYVAARFTQLAIVCLAALVIAYLLVDVLERLQWFARHAARFDEIARFYSARIPLLVSRVTPMGLVAAMALTVSLLTSTGELVGMRALGISSRQALRPALILCLLATPLSFLLNDQIVPRTNELADMIKQRDIKEEGETQRTAVWGMHENTLYQFASLDASRGAAEDIVVYPLLASGLPTGRIDARSILHVGGGHWQLNDATGVAFDENGRLSSITPPRVIELDEQPLAELDLMYLSVAEQFRLIRELADRGESTTELEVDLNLKLATPLACFILPALVMIIASSGPPFPGSALTLILAGSIAVAYTLLVGAFASFGRGGVMAPWVGGWGPSLIMIAGLIGLTWRNQVAQRMD